MISLSASGSWAVNQSRIIGSLCQTKSELLQIIGVGCIVTVFSGCATPVLNIAEPEESQRVVAKSVLDTVQLDAPPTSMEWTQGAGLDRVLPVIRSAAFSVCTRMNLQSTHCDKVQTSSVTLYTGEKTINAYADQNDDIGVFAGLVKTMGKDAEIAAVLAHEFSHVMLGHVEKKTKNALAGMSVAAGLAAILAGATGSNLESYGEDWMRVGASIGHRAYSPEMEIESDRMAIYILHEAGYSPTGMRDAIVRLYRAKPVSRKRRFSSSRVGFLQTHPSNDRRIAHILSAIEDVLAGVPLTEKN